MADGMCTRRLHETRPIPVFVKGPFGQSISMSSGTVTAYEGVEGDSTYPLVYPPLFSNRPITSLDNPIPSTARGWLAVTPSSMGMNAGQKYTLVYNVTIVAGNSTDVFTIVVVLTVLSDTE